MTKRITVISAPAGSGKTSLLRAWADRSTDVRRVALMSVDRDEQDAQQFWCSVLDAIRGTAGVVLGFAAHDQQVARCRAPQHDQGVDEIFEPAARVNQTEGP